MAKCGRPPVLDEVKQREILAILSMGCNRRTAAAYVGCDPSTIQNTAERNPRFAEKLSRAQSSAVVAHVKNINSAAKKEQYWRAAAWALERLDPESYAAPHPELLSPKQMSQLITFVCQIISEEVPASKYRKNVIKRFEDICKMADELVPSGPPEKANDASKTDEGENNEKKDRE